MSKYLDGPTKIRFTLEEVNLALREAVAKNPYQNPTMWKEVQQYMIEQTGKNFSLRLIREHINILVETYKSDPLKLRRARSHDEHVEKLDLLRQLGNMKEIQSQLNRGLSLKRRRNTSNEPSKEHVDCSSDSDDQRRGNEPTEIVDVCSIKTDPTMIPFYPRVVIRTPNPTAASINTQMPFAPSPELKNKSVTSKPNDSHQDDDKKQQLEHEERRLNLEEKRLELEERRVALDEAKHAFLVEMHNQQKELLQALLKKLNN